jgi:hypothetical protein
MALRFEGDDIVPCARFQTWSASSGRGSRPSPCRTPRRCQGTGRQPHSVLTLHLNRADPDGETMKVHRRVLDFFKERTGA